MVKGTVNLWELHCCWMNRRENPFCTSFAHSVQCTSGSSSALLHGLKAAVLLLPEVQHFAFTAQRDWLQQGVDLQYVVVLHRQSRFWKAFDAVASALASAALSLQVELVMDVMEDVHALVRTKKNALSLIEPADRMADSEASWEGFLLLVKYFLHSSRVWSYDHTTNDVQAPDVLTTTYYGSMPSVSDMCRDVQHTAAQLNLAQQVVALPLLLPHCQPYHKHLVLMAVFVQTKKTPTKERMTVFLDSLRSSLTIYPDTYFHVRDYESAGTNSRIVSTEGFSVPWPISTDAQGQKCVASKAPNGWPIDASVVVAQQQHKSSNLLHIMDDQEA